MLIFRIVTLKYRIPFLDLSMQLVFFFFHLSSRQCNPQTLHAYWFCSNKNTGTYLVKVIMRVSTKWEINNKKYVALYLIQIYLATCWKFDKLKNRAEGTIIYFYWHEHEVWSYSFIQYSACFLVKLKTVQNIVHYNFRRRTCLKTFTLHKNYNELLIRKSFLYAFIDNNFPLYSFFNF